MHSKVNKYLEQQSNYKAPLTLLRDIIIECGLTEDFKWRNPCYTYNGKNVLLLGSFKEICFINFFKGALLKDELKLLKKITENVQAGRHLRFSTLNEVIAQRDIIKVYIFEAIEIEKAGLKVKMKETADFEQPEELSDYFSSHPKFKKAFLALTPGRQRGYLLYFSQAKQSATKTKRIEKNVQRILAGKGLNDCICGLSKRMPNCDGSHKKLESD